MREKRQFYEKFVATYPVSMDGDLPANPMGGAGNYVRGTKTNERGNDLVGLWGRGCNIDYCGGWVQRVIRA